MIRVGIIGGAGYTAGELIRLLVNHPQAEIAFVHSTSNAGNRLAQVHGGLEGDTGMRFCDAYDLGAIDVLFLCSAHGQSRVWMEENTIPAGVKIIDLAQDFRDESCGFVYGLPELNRERIRRAQRVAGADAHPDAHRHRAPHHRERRKLRTARPARRGPRRERRAAGKARERRQSHPRQVRRRLHHLRLRRAARRERELTEECLLLYNSKY